MYILRPPMSNVRAKSAFVVVPRSFAVVVADDPKRPASHTLAITRIPATRPAIHTPVGLTVGTSPAIARSMDMGVPLTLSENRQVA